MGSWGRRVGFVLVAAAMALFGCGEGADGLTPVPNNPVVNPPTPPPPEQVSGGTPDAGETADAGAVDAGVTADAGVVFDAGTPDAGAPIDAGQPVDAGAPVDAGSPEDAGQPVDAGRPADAGTPVVDAGTPDAGPTVVLPSAAGWTFYGQAAGGPTRAYGAAADENGNIWLAGGDQGLFVLKPGATNFIKFTVADGLAGYTDSTGVHGYRVLSVAGGPGSTVYVGYKGLPGADLETSPSHIQKSGDADKVVFNGATITVSHIDISTPPGEDSHYPQGREKLNDIHRIIANKSTGDVWFGGNHGIAMWHGGYHRSLEHQHADINGYTGNGCSSTNRNSCIYTLMSGEYFGIGLDGNGDFLFGGGHRVAKLKFSQGRNFWASIEKFDIWPDPVRDDGYPDQRKDDYIQDMAVQGSSVWVGSIPNGLAQLSPTGVNTHPDLNNAMVDKKVTSLETDPADGSLWVGHIYGGITRFKNGNVIKYDYRVLGGDLITAVVPDIQSDMRNGNRRLIVTFSNGVLGVFTGN